MKNFYLLFLALLLVLLGCNRKMDSETYTKYKESGNEITNQTQAVLLANVGAAIQQGGPEYAIEFCNLKVAGIVDSLNRVNNCSVSRVSEKNRNPGNALKTKTDRQLWETFRRNSQTDTVVMVSNRVFYYKRINTAMPACLKCHGDPQNDINTPTLEKLQKLYPEDLATGYQLNDFRGLWKVEFTD